MTLDGDSDVLAMVNAACGDIFEPPVAIPFMLAPAAAPLLDEHMDALPAIDFSVAPSALVNTQLRPTLLGSSTFAMWVGTVTSNSGGELSPEPVPPLACLFSGVSADPASGAPSFEVGGTTVGMSSTRLTVDEYYDYQNALLWVGNQTVGFNASLPADGRIIVAAYQVDGASLEIWYQGTKMMSAATTDVLAGGYLASLGAYAFANGTLAYFCGCSMHELVVASPAGLLLDDVIVTVIEYAAAAWNISLT